MYVENSAKKKRNVKKIGQFSGTNILQTTKLIFLQIWYVYGRHKMPEFGIDRCSSYRDVRG